MDDRAGEWGLFADRALVFQLALFEERLDGSLTAGTCVAVKGLRPAVTYAVAAVPGTADIRAIDSHRDHLALRANKRLLALAGIFVGARATGYCEKCRER